ncbi:MAG: hypothetical protein HYT08_04620 [Candidatus Levybacteria bacterium]|nr:hypothetical protein [Candidatus Levybacteria bacterium]
MLLILTGPAGAGKNTVSKILSSERKKCAIVDVDTVRHMITKPHRAPWDGEEGQKQVALGIRNACILTKNFIAEGFDVIILDVITDEIARIYKESLSQFNPKIVLLLPTLEETLKRNKSRDFTLEEERVKILHMEQGKLKEFDEKIDSTELTLEETADRIKGVV